MKFKDMNDKDLINEYISLEEAIEHSTIMNKDYNDLLYMEEELIKRKYQKCHSTVWHRDEIDEEDITEEPDYKTGFNILMEYWDSISDEEKLGVAERLTEVGL